MPWHLTVKHLRQAQTGGMDHLAFHEDLYQVLRSSLRQAQTGAISHLAIPELWREYSQLLASTPNGRHQAFSPKEAYRC